MKIDKTTSASVLPKAEQPSGKNLAKKILTAHNVSINNLPDEMLRQISKSCTDLEFNDLRLTCTHLANALRPELNFRKNLKESKKFINAYCGFEGKEIDDLDTSDLIEIIETQIKKPIKVKRDWNHACIEFANIFKEISVQIARSDPPSETNGRIRTKTIQGIPAGQTAAVMLPNFLVTYDGANSYIYELKNRTEDEGTIEAIPCLSYGKDAGQATAYIHSGKCLAMSKNAAIIVLYNQKEAKISILSKYTEKIYSGSDWEAFNIRVDFFSSEGECNISPDGKRLCFLFRTNYPDDYNQGNLVLGFSNTPFQTDTFKFMGFDLFDTEGLNHYQDLALYTIHHIAQPINHRWFMISSYCCSKDDELLFVPLPLGPAPTKFCSGLSFSVCATAALPDNTIAAASEKEIRIFDSEANMRAICQIPDGEIHAMESFPDGRILAVALNRSVGSASGKPPTKTAEIAFYQIPDPFPQSMPSAAAAASRDAEVPTLKYLYRVPLDRAADRYAWGVTGSQLKILDRDNPNKLTFCDLIDQTAIPAQSTSGTS
jgi:hypothetical protein